MMRRIYLPFFMLILVVVFMVFNSHAKAQGGCVDGYYEIGPEEFTSGWGDFVNISNSVHTSDYGGTIRADNPAGTYAKFKIDASAIQAALGVLDPIPAYDVRTDGFLRSSGIVEYYVFIYDTEGNSTYFYNTSNWPTWSQFGTPASWPPGNLDRIEYWAGSSNPESVWWNDISIYVPCTSVSICSTVLDYHFTNIITGTWLLSGSASITDSILTLPPGDAAAQNLSTLSSNTTYESFISVVQITDTVDLNLVLGTDTQAVSITSTGIYSAEFTTPTLGGPIGYGLENDSISGTVGIDYTCLYSAEEGGEPECVAPTNGEFNGSSNWEWYRGATYQPLRQNAYLPFNEGGEADKSLLVSSSVFTLPTLSAGEYLNLKFNSETQFNQSGVLGTRVATVISDTQYFFEIYGYEYEFEADISDMAGESDVSLAFVNAGVDPLTGFSAEDHIYLDDVCIYVSEEPPDLPGPTDPSPVIPPLAGAGSWTCLSCSQIPGILLGYGISVYYLEEIYQNGISVWDASGWVPWLAAALWVHAASPGACFLLALWCWFLGIVQYLLNEALNWFFWIYRSGTAFGVWLPLVVAWLWSSLLNIINWTWQTAYDWLVWLGQSAADFNLFLFYSLWTLGRWVAEGLIWLASNIAGFDIFIQLWNLVAPLLQKIWSYISTVSLLSLLINLFLSFISSGWELFLMLITWIWENIFLGVSFPLQFYYAFDSGVSSSSFDYLLSCSNQNFWCSLLAGFQIINQSASHSIMYPAIIVGIIVTTLFIFWKDIRALFSIDVK